MGPVGLQVIVQIAANCTSAKLIEIVDKYICAYKRIHQEKHAENNSLRLSISKASCLQRAICILISFSVCYSEPQRKTF